MHSPSIKYGIRQDGTAWISVGDPDNPPHAACDIELPEWALKLLIPNQWTPCSEKLPDVNVEVLACTETRNVGVARRKWEQGRATPDHWVMDGGGRLEMAEVTHWMLKPVAP